MFMIHSAQKMMVSTHPTCLIKCIDGFEGVRLGVVCYNSAKFIAEPDPEFIVISSSGRGRKRVLEIFTRSLTNRLYSAEDKRRGNYF
jgi:hypothetical protein